MAKKRKVEKIKYPVISTTFMAKGQEYLYCGTNVETNEVVVKNMKSGNKGTMDFYKLQKLIDNGDD